MAIAIASVFATALPSSSSLSLNFTVTDSLSLIMDSSMNLKVKIPTFTVGSTASGGSGITASADVDTHCLLMDNSTNNKVSTTLYINLANPTAWACTTLLYCYLRILQSKFVEAMAANNVTCTVETANANLRLSYGAVVDNCRNCDRRSYGQVALATFIYNGEQRMFLRNLSSTIAVTYTTT